MGMDDGLIEYITYDGSVLGYSRYADDTDKPPLLFIHGYAMRSTAGPYEELMRILAKNYAVYALDLRGHGASATSFENWSFETLADDIAAFIRIVGLERPVFAGHSFGAVVGLFTEVRHPGIFSHLCLLTPGPADHTKDAPDALNFMIDHGRNREMLRSGFGSMFVRDQADLLESVLDAVTILDSAVHKALRDCNSHFSIDDRLGEIAAPVLMMSGALDTVVPPDIQHDMAGKLRRCKEIRVADAGHMMPIENATATACSIFDFLDANGC